MITKEQIKSIMPYAGASDIDRFIDPINDTLLRFDISTKQRQAAFLAQIAHESNCLKNTEENLNYSAERLAAVWPRRFATDGKPNFTAEAIARQPERIANIVYANRMGNAESGDGWKYRGRGLKQITGRNNYTALTHYFKVDFVKNPDLVSGPLYAALSAGWFWYANDLNRFADVDDFKGLTKAINGGLIGYEDRVKFWELAKKSI